MRLIDADALKEKFKEHYALFVNAYENEQDMSLADKSRVDEILNGMAEVINAPTVCDIEQIRAEIENEADEYDAYVNADVARGLYKAGEIIDKHMN